MTDPQITPIAQMGQSLLGPGEEMVERDPRTYAIIGAAMEVHSVLGWEFLEASELNTGLLLNFGKPSLEYRRFVL